MKKLTVPFPLSVASLPLARFQMNHVVRLWSIFLDTVLSPFNGDYLQIKVLKILAKLGDGDKSTSELMYGVLGDVLKKADIASNIGNAILYECIRTITSVHPHTKLIGDVAEITSRFLKVYFTLKHTVATKA